MGVDTSLTGLPTFDHLEIIKTGTGIIPAVGAFDHSELHITHNLGFKPIVIAYTDYFNEITPLPGSPLGSHIQGGDGFVRFQTWVSIYVTDAFLTFSHWNALEAAGVGALRVKYYLLRSRAV